MPEEAQQSDEVGTFRRVVTPTSVSFEEIPKPAPTGQASVETAKSKSRRDLELEAGAKRVAENAALLKNRPPRVVSETERRSQGSSVPVFRPNMTASDNMTKGLGPLLRKVGGNVAAKV